MSLNHLNGKNEKHRCEQELDRHVAFVVHPSLAILPNKISSWTSETENICYANTKKNDDFRETYAYSVTYDLDSSRQ